MASDWYDEGLNQLLRGAASATNWSTGTIKLALMKTGFSFTATDDFFNDIASNECNASGYTTGGQALDNESVSEAAGVVTYDADNETFSSLGGTTNNTILGAVVYRDTGTTTTSPLLFFIDFTDTLTNGGDFTVQFHANGIARVT